jgi:hypothetical protein
MNDRHMVGVFGEKASLGQANGSDVDLIVRGTEFYATYETLDGFPVIYDDSLGLFCYARIVGGGFETTGIAVTSPPPPGVERHATESDEVRIRKIEERTQQMDQRSKAKPK